MPRRRRRVTMGHHLGAQGNKGSKAHESWDKRSAAAPDSPTEEQLAEEQLEMEGSGLVPKHTKHIKFTTDRYKIRINKMTDPIDSALDLLRRLNPKDVKRNVDDIIQLNPSLEEDLLESVDIPLTVKKCSKTKRDFLCCDYNRDGDSWRSPWSNEFEPPIEEGVTPSDRVRSMEVKANEAFDVYRELYFEGGISSVYLWDMDDGFAGCVLLKKSVNPTPKSSGSWDSIHVFDAQDRARTSHYKLTSTVILSLGTVSEDLGGLDLSGNMVRQVEADMAVEDDTSHVANIGKMVEDMELKMRNLLSEVYFGKAKDVVGDLRSIQSLSQTNKDRATQREMINSMGR
ncbi:F-actin-capping subunit beta [Pyrenophora seminiperda CCB06]|uniref:F-actin-capping protein subunit beta n=1 Tax=Pyrenophora seminiperda CCB06 TaxID=1302712 RepID=A0A3M7LWR1_9PLEO|nr:F-actin-capping subunit beta [Pyrenophora seminiperda CCB06]